MTSTEKKREGIAVELYFDAESEGRLVAFRKNMYAQTGITPVLGKLNDRPHVSLAVFGCTDPKPLLEVCAVFFTGVDKMPFELSAVGTFPTPDNVLFLTPVPNFLLLDLHRRFHETLKENHLRSSAYYLPGRWVPHCTVEFDLPDAHLDFAMAHYRKNFTPAQGVFTHAGVVEFRPVEYLADYDLKG